MIQLDTLFSRRGETRFFVNGIEVTEEFQGQVFRAERAALTIQGKEQRTSAVEALGRFVVLARENNERFKQERSEARGNYV